MATTTTPVGPELKALHGTDEGDRLGFLARTGLALLTRGDLTDGGTHHLHLVSTLEGLWDWAETGWIGQVTSQDMTAGEWIAQRETWASDLANEGGNEGCAAGMVAQLCRACLADFSDAAYHLGGARRRMGLALAKRSRI